MRTLTGSLRFLVDMAAERSRDCRRDGGARRVSARRGFARLRALAGFGVPCAPSPQARALQGVSRLGCWRHKA